MMNSVPVRQLVRYLSTAEPRSSEAIGRYLDCSLAGVRDRLEHLAGLGLEVEHVAGQGFWLESPPELLEREAILARTEQAALDLLTGLSIESSVDSTNSAIKRLLPDQQHGHVVLAEHQTAGRGRMGRHWVSPFGRNIYLSLGWQFTNSLSDLGCLPLVVALASARALSRAGLSGHKVKWPNDLLIESRKVSGCLVELQGDSHGPFNAVVGVGINVNMPASEATSAIEKPWTDLKTHLPDCTRNQLAAWLLEELLLNINRYANDGFEPFRAMWEEFDGLAGTEVRVRLGQQLLEGTARGIDRSGALLLDTGGKVQSLHAGEVSISRTD